ncbi:MAG: SAM-dependent chlorinase/fluorinase [Gammaproteobacteria bacterium]|nr:SAM-dependent chlorinase/fluorinase [Gammaproteobacteria bacterium]
MIALFTDFGLTDPYVGQMHAVLAREAPGVPVVDLFHSVPSFNIRAGAYLLPAYSRDFPPETVFVCVVDPGVGGVRRPVMINADSRWYVGPDNGLFEMVRRRAREHQCHVIRWRPAKMSASFHGRDLFAPVAARLARGEMPDAEPAELAAPPDAPWPEDLPEIIHIDHYGNVITGLRAISVSTSREIRAGGEVIKYARVFSEVPPGEVFWYENANGLVEIAVHGGSAAVRIGCKPGDPVTLQ